MEEIWKSCYGYEGIIEVSSLGRFKSLDRVIRTNSGHRRMTGIIRKPTNDKNGYQLATISIDGVSKSEKLHRLIMKSFKLVENCDKLEVNHKDGDKTNNRLDNLEWATRKDNMAHAFKTGLMPERPVNMIGKKCLVCETVFHSYKKMSKYCSQKCNVVSRQTVERPSKDELFELLSNNPFTLVGEMFGVTDNSIRKWCKSYGIPTKSKHYRELKKS